MRTGASGLSSLSDSPFYGAMPTTARASANGANASGGSASCGSITIRQVAYHASSGHRIGLISMPDSASPARALGQGSCRPRRVIVCVSNLPNSGRPSRNDHVMHCHRQDRALVSGAGGHVRRSDSVCTRELPVKRARYADDANRNTRSSSVGEATRSDVVMPATVTVVGMTNDLVAT